MIAAVCCAALFVWIRQESMAAGIVRPTRVWLAVGALCYVNGVAVAAAVMIALRPAVHVSKMRKRTHSIGSPISSLCLCGTLLVMLTSELTLWPWVSGAAIMVYVLATVRVLRHRIPITKPPDVSVTPHEEGRSLDSTATEELQWDVFLSYRAATDSNAVRRIADLLIRHGVRPWFAEYEITPAEWENAEVITKKLAQGIVGSRHFLIFTNNLWTKSAWCNAEMQSILKCVQQRQDGGSVKSLSDVVAEVRMPPAPEPHAVFPDLAHAESFIIGNDIEAVWDFLERDLKWFPGPRTMRHS